MQSDKIHPKHTITHLLSNLISFTTAGACRYLVDTSRYAIPPFCLPKTVSAAALLVVSVHKSSCEEGEEESDRRKRKKERKGGGGSYLRLHGSVHGGGLGGAAIGERFRGAGRQRGLLGRRGSLRGALNVLTVPLVGLG